jgi:hypothetical protein
VSTSKVPEPRPPAARRSWPRRIATVLALGVAGFVLLSLAPSLLLRLSGADLSAGRTPQAEEPVVRGADGRPVNASEQLLRQGRVEAVAAGITTHAECRSRYAEDRQALLRLGCNRLVTERKAFPAQAPRGGAATGITTAECVAEVNAYWEPRYTDRVEQGDNRGAAVMQARHWSRQLRSCQNHDNVRVLTAVYEPAMRLDALIARLDAGNAVQPDELEQLQRDILSVAAWPDPGLRTPFFSKVDRFYRLAGGQEPPRPERVQLELSCAEIEAQLQRLREAEAADVQAQLALKRGDTVTDGARWAALNQSRLNRLWDWKLYSDGARAAGCVPAEPAAASAPAQPPK